MKNLIILASILMCLTAHANDRESDCDLEALKYVKPVARVFFDQIAEDSGWKITGLKFTHVSTTTTKDFIYIEFRVSAKKGFDEQANFTVRINDRCSFEDITLTKF